MGEITTLSITASGRLLEWGLACLQRTRRRALAEVSYYYCCFRIASRRFERHMHSIDATLTD